jgi:hypothetical protein
VRDGGPQQTALDAPAPRVEFIYTLSYRGNFWIFKDLSIHRPDGSPGGKHSSVD